MSSPKTESYAMEALLQPYVHYIPIEEDGSDLERQLEWARHHDEKVKWISAQATRFMEDLWLSEQAIVDNVIVRHDLAKLYQKQFGKELEQCQNERKKNEIENQG